MKYYIILYNGNAFFIIYNTNKLTIFTLNFALSTFVCIFAPNKTPRICLESILNHS